jgi:hypothetical protein
VLRLHGSRWRANQRRRIAYEKAKSERDKLAAEFKALYPQIEAQLRDILPRIATRTILEWQQVRVPDPREAEPHKLSERYPTDKWHLQAGSPIGRESSARRSYDGGDQFMSSFDLRASEMARGTTGFGAVGILGWRRKRKAAALTAQSKRSNRNSERPPRGGLPQYMSPPLAHSGHLFLHRACPLSGVKPT